MDRSISPEEIAVMAALIYPTIAHTADRTKLAVKAARAIALEVEQTQPQPQSQAQSQSQPAPEDELGLRWSGH